MKQYTITGLNPEGKAATYASGINEDCVQETTNEALDSGWRQMTAFIEPLDTVLENGKAAMRGNIATVGIETAAALWADEIAGPFNREDHARIRGAFLAAYEAGQLDGITNKTERVF